MIPGEIDFLIWLERARGGFLNFLFEAITFIGEETLPVILITAIYFMLDKDLAHRMFFVTISSMSANNIIKNLAKVPRPLTTGKVHPLRIETATGYSFPSGHTQTISTWSSTLAYRFRKWYFYLFAAIAIPAVAFSRLYLGAHYPSDVLCAMLIGITLAIALNFAYDKIKNRNVLYLCAIFVSTPFAIVFFISGDPVSADLFKVYGMLIGGYLGSVVEGRFASFGFDVPIWKKVVRAVGGLAVAMVIKLGLDFADLMPNIQLSLLSDMLRYFLLVFAVMGLMPLLYKKIKL